MSPGVRRRGQPLAVLGVLLASWIVARTLVWQSPFPIPAALAERAVVEARNTANISPAEADPRVIRESHPATVGPRRGRPGVQRLVPSLAHGSPPLAAGDRASLRRLPSPAGSTQLALRDAPVRKMPGREWVGSPASSASPGSSRPPFARLSAGGWLLLRIGPAARLAVGPFAGRYGGSQAGAVLRYRLSPDSRRPALYARATAALSSAGEREVAVGFSARPFPHVPLAAQVELRALRASGRTELRPGAFAVTELKPLALPFGVRAEIYGQAGYVGGRFATPFADGQVRIDREIADLGSAKVRLGGGAWGGAQKGAAALDVGPGAVIELNLGETPARIALDYRLRAAGVAAPRDGLALTLSTGF